MVSTVYEYKAKLQFLKNYLGGKCVKCGARSNLEFDHIIPETKSFSITSKWAYNFEKLKPELDKCQLLCTPCHVGKTNPSALAHGTTKMYRHGKCRCTLCKAANTAKQKAYRVGEKYIIETLPANGKYQEEYKARQAKGAALTLENLFSKV